MAKKKIDDKKKTKKSEVKKRIMPISPGRPSLYTDEIADKICDIVATSNKGLKSIADSSDEFPAYQTLTSWLMKKDHPFIEKYARAKAQQSDHLVDEMLEISDQCHNVMANVHKARLQVDTRKFIAAKLRPKKYGERIIQEHTGGEDGKPIQIESKRVNLDALSTSELLQFKQLLEKAGMDAPE